MITLKRPTDDNIRAMLKRVEHAPFTYDAVGCVERETPSGFSRDETVVALGHGEVVWRAAQDAIRSWVMFPAQLVSMVRLSDVIETGTVVAVLCKSLGTWTTCPARILAVKDTSVGGIHRFGFTYGTLPGHVEAGEELFCVEWNTSTDEVTYRLNAVSRPRHILCWLAYPYTRMMQAKFRRLSAAAMQHFVSNNTAVMEDVTPASTQKILTEV